MRIWREYWFFCGKWNSKKFTLNELNSALSSWEEDAPGPDGIFYSMLRNLHPTTYAFLLDLNRLIFITGTFPLIWRKSIVVPIPKQEKDPMVDSNQCPISMTILASSYRKWCISTSLWTGSVGCVKCISIWLPSVPFNIWPSPHAWEKYSSNL